MAEETGKSFGIDKFDEIGRASCRERVLGCNWDLGFLRVFFCTIVFFPDNSEIPATPWT